jgi:hypothetical protein
MPSKNYNVLETTTRRGFSAGISQALYSS